MADFIRPAINAVTSIEELTVGTKLYHVFGIWPPFVAAYEYTVTRAPIRYDQHPEKLHSNAMDSLVFDTNNGKHTEMQFCTDGNIGGHHNSNYWFKSREDAEIYRAQCHQDWTANPEEIEHVKELRHQDMLDSIDDDYYYEED